MVTGLPVATPGAKMMFLIKRRPTATRDELIVHWFANHMPLVIQAQMDQKSAGKRHALRYIASLFDENPKAEHAWDGVAQLWWDKPLRRPAEPMGTTPTDTFQQKAEPYLPWATSEYVLMDGSEHLAVEPLTLNAPYPCTRSGFFKVTFLVKAKENADCAEFFEHWLSVHVPNVRKTMEEVGGYRYVVSHSIEPGDEPYAGMAELYFPDASGWSRYREVIKPDGMEAWVEPQGTLVLQGRTEMIGIP